jgi:hypothetical protein
MQWIVNAIKQKKLPTGVSERARHDNQSCKPSHHRIARSIVMKRKEKYKRTVSSKKKKRGHQMPDAESLRDKM